MDDRLFLYLSLPAQSFPSFQSQQHLSSPLETSFCRFAASPLVPLPFMFSSSPSRLRESTTYSPVRQSIEDDVNVITIPTPKQHGFLLSAQASNCRSAGRPASVHVFKFAMSHSCRNRAASETKYPAPGAECRLGSKDGHQVQLHSGMQHSWPRPYFSPPGTSPCS